MKRILLYENRKQDPKAWDASTNDNLEKAFLGLFKHLDKDWSCYEVDMGKRHLALRDKARTGDCNAAHTLLNQRRAYEYESWYLVELEEYE